MIADTSDLRNQAKVAALPLWARGPSPRSSADLLRLRFHITDLVRDLEAMPDGSASTALMASGGIRLVLEALCAVDRIWMPPIRSALSALSAQYPAVIPLIERCAEAGFPGSSTLPVAESVLQRLGGRLESYDTVAITRQA